MWRVVLYQRYIVYFIYCIRHLMALVYVLSVIMMEYIISYREVCYLVNRLGIQFVALHRPNSWHLPNTALNIYSSWISFHPLNHNHYTKESFMRHSVPVSLFAIFNPLQPSICNATKQTDRQPEISMIPDHVIQKYFYHLSKLRTCLYPLPHKSMAEILLKMPQSWHT